jgi:hypothetical protein
MGLFKKNEPIEYLVGDKPLLCLVCGNETFRQRRALLNTVVATFFDFDWANRSANCLVCSRCKYVHWFLT